MKTKEPTVLDFAILGLLKKESLSGYQIRKVFEETAMGNYSSSPGSIYPALKRMQQLRYIGQILNDSSGKMQFAITPKGLEVLKDWILKPLALVDVQKRLDELLLRFAFMDDLVDKAQVLLFLDSLIELIQTHLTVLKEYVQQTEHQNPYYAQLAVDHGIQTLKATLSWSKKVKNLINKT